MARFITRRLLLSLITMWLLVTIVFVITNVLPNDVGRTIVGPVRAAGERRRAQPEARDGPAAHRPVRRPRMRGWSRSISAIRSSRPGGPAPDRRRHRAVGEAGRPGPADHRSRSASPPACTPADGATGRSDRAIVLLGVTSSSIPEFVTGTILVVVVGVQLEARYPCWPRRRRTPTSSTQIRYLLMPAIAMAIVYFGYIARMTRAGTIEVLQSDYTRTATMKGLTTGQVMRRHVLRNALIPTVAVIAVQIGYLFGGIIAVEKIFNYNGMGATMLFAAQRKDIPMLTAGAIVIGIVYMLATLVADLIIAWMNPRIRLDASR